MFENSQHNIHRSSNLTSYEKEKQKRIKTHWNLNHLKSSVYLASFIQIFLVFSNTEFNQPNSSEIGNLTERE